MELELMDKDFEEKEGKNPTYEELEDIAVAYILESNRLRNKCNVLISVCLGLATYGIGITISYLLS